MTRDAATRGVGTHGAAAHEQPSRAAPPPRPTRTRTVAAPLVAPSRTGLALALVVALGASMPPAPARAREPSPASPAPTAWLDALAAVQRQPRAYHGSVGHRSLHVGLGLPGPDGRFGGTAVLLDAANHVVAAGPVRGRVQGQACRLRLDLGDITARVDGACRPDTLSGLLDEVRHQPFGLLRFLLAKGDEHVVGEVWLTRGP